jgi:hypothetical protein
MVKNHFSRKYLCLLLALAIVSIAGGDVQGAKEEKDKDAKEKTYALNEAQLQSHVMSFADRFASILDTAIAKFEAHDLFAAPGVPYRRGVRSGCRLA